MNQLRDAFDDLADAAPRAVPDDHAAIWRRGVRRRNARRAGAVVASLALLGGVGLGAAAVVDGRDLTEAPVVDAPDLADLRLPQELYQPSGWLPGTDEAGPPGRIAAVWWDMDGRSGWTGTRPGWMTVSAIDGSYRWLDVDVAAVQIGPPPVRLSPDGRYLAWADSSGAPEAEQSGESILTSVADGYSVYDAETGDVQRLDLAAEAPHGMVATPPTWSADSGHLVFRVCPLPAPGQMPTARQCDRKPLSVWEVGEDTASPVVDTEGAEILGRTADAVLLHWSTARAAGTGGESRPGEVAELRTRGGGIVMRPLGFADLPDVGSVVGGYYDVARRQVWVLGRDDDGTIRTARVPVGDGQPRMQSQPGLSGDIRYVTGLVGARLLGNEPMLLAVLEGGDLGPEVDAVGIGRRADGAVTTSVSPFTGQFLDVAWDLASAGEWESDPAPPPSPLDPRLPVVGVGLLGVLVGVATLLVRRRRSRA